MFSYDSCIVLAVAFRSLIHFELFLFRCNVRIHIHCLAYRYPHILASIFKRLFLSILVKSELTIDIWTLCSLSNFVDVYFYLTSSVTFFDYCIFVIWLEIGRYESSSFFLLFKVCFVSLGSLVLPYYSED